MASAKMVHILPTGRDELSHIYTASDILQYDWLYDTSIYLKL